MTGNPIFLLFIAATLGSAASWPTALPSSARSRKAVERVRPGLERDLGEKGARYGAPVFMRIFKESSELELWIGKGDGFELFRTYRICTFSGLPGPKISTGDMQSPEGFYSVTPDRMNPFSRYHLSFDIGYPNEYDRSHGRTGSALMVHGDCVSVGCYAMTDDRIEEIYALAQAAFENGQPYFSVHIFPFRMTGEKMRGHRDSRWSAFWNNLKEGYDLFETHRKVPEVGVKEGRYVFRGYY